MNAMTTHNLNFEVVNIKGKEFVFIDKLSFGYPLEFRGAERAVPPRHVQCRCDFILKVKRETEEIIRGIQDVRNYIQRHNDIFDEVI